MERFTEKAMSSTRGGASKALASGALLSGARS